MIEYSSLTLPELDAYVKVTGISSCYMQGSVVNRLIKVRTQADIVPIQP